MKDLTEKYKSRELLDVSALGNSKFAFYPGDKVRSYRSAFDNDKPYKNSYTEGVVLATKDKDMGEGYLTVKWTHQCLFGLITPVEVFGKDTFAINVNTPNLVKINNGQLSLPL